jgi:SdiA-regulated
MLNLGKKNGSYFSNTQFILKRFFALVSVYIYITLTACNKKPVYHSPPGYNFSAPVTMKLGKELKEISGIVYDDRTNMLFAQNDEQGRLFRLSFEPNKQSGLEHITFGSKNDYEDVVKTDSSIFILNSNGSLIEMPFTANLFDSLPAVSSYINHVKGEFESFYYDAAANTLVTICKSCAHEKNKMRTAYKFDIATGQFADAPFYTIDIGVIKQLLKDESAEFFPSAAAVHPMQKKLYIVSSIGKLLLITDLRGKIEKIFRIDPRLFPQPEGMTFAPNGDLYISNEAAGGTATILKFIYKP